jgi:riboflavin kinase / FMN adenylyltransferase
MQVHRDIEHLPKFHHGVVTIGTFDGVHLGHQQIIRQLKAESAACGGETVIITFHPHPRKVVPGNFDGFSLLNSLEEKIELLTAHGIDHLVIVPFTSEFSKMRAEDYVSKFLVAKFHPHILIIGYDHRFGNDRKGNYELLEAMGPLNGFTVREIPEHIINSLTVSSTNIRKSLKYGRLEDANENLGYPYMLTGTVMHGDKRGRTIGFPTANLDISDKEKLIPANGVYAVKVLLEKNETTRIGMMNIGFRPTVDGSKKMIEVNIFDFSEEIYGHRIRVILYQYIRQEKKFESLPALQTQLGKDREQVLTLMAGR